MPLGQLPVLKVDGKSYCQTAAIAKFAGGRAHAAGALPALDEIEGLRCNMIAETVREVIEGINKDGYGAMAKAEGT